MRISSTLSQAGGNFARPTKYSMVLAVPPALRTTFTQELDVLCKTVQLPSAVNEPYEIKIKGHSVKIPGRTQQVQEISVTFYVDEKYKVKSLFQDWVQGLDNRSPVPRNSQSQGLVNASKDDKMAIYGEMELIGRDFYESTDKPISWKFENVYPTSVGEIDYSTNEKDTIIEFTVSFAYSRYITNTPISRETVEDLDNSLNQIQG